MARSKYTDEQFIEIAKESLSVAGALRKMNLKATGGNYSGFNARVLRLGIDVSHFTGQGHLKGKTHESKTKIPLVDILVKNSTYVSTNSLRLRLIKENIFEAKCSKCEYKEWQGLPIPLQLDHINGVRNDNRIENLRLLCPNCHAQTDTYCGKNIKRYKHIIEEKKRLVEEKQKARIARIIKVQKRFGPNSKEYKLDSKQHLRKVERPSYDTLQKDLEDSNYCAVARKYGVSDNCVRKWIKHYEKYGLLAQ